MDSKKEQPSALIVGAGISGLLLASTLKDNGWRVTVVDKGRGVGGRMATRRLGGGRADHGAQFFTVRDPRFAEWVERWKRDGLIEVWFDHLSPESGDRGSGHPRYRGAGGMTAVPKALASALDVRNGVRVEGMEWTGSGWRVHAGGGNPDPEIFDWVALTAPVPQSLDLLEEERSRLPEETLAGLRAVDYDRGLALMVVLEGQSGWGGWGGAKLEDPDLAWVADNHLKGISPERTVLTLHSTPAFARRHWDTTDEVRVPALLAALERTGRGVSGVTETSLHRWGFTQPTVSFADEALVLPDLRLALAGDGFGGSKVEGAAVSGLEAARRMLAEAHGRSA